MKKIEIPVPKKAEVSTSIPNNEMNRDPDELYFEDYLIIFFGVLSMPCWITAFCEMIGLK